MSEPDIQIQRDYPQTLVNSQWVKWAAERIAELEAENKAMRGAAVYAKGVLSKYVNGEMVLGESMRNARDALKAAL